MTKLICKFLDKAETEIFEVYSPLNIEFGSLDRGDITDLTNWGIYSNVGRVEFIDKNHNFEEIVGEIEFVRIYHFSPTREILLATFLIDDFEYDYETKKVNITLKDSCLGLQTKYLEEYFPFYTSTLYNIFNGNILRFAGATPSVVSKMSLIMIETSYMEASTVWAAINKVCQTAMVRCFCDSEGVPLISDETPRKSEYIMIEPKNILSVDKTIRKEKTKVEFVSIKSRNITPNYAEPLFEDKNITCWNVLGGVDTDANGFNDNLDVSWGNVEGALRLVIGQTGYTGIRVYNSEKLPENVYRIHDDGVVATKYTKYISQYGVISEGKKSTEDATYEPSKPRAYILENKVHYSFEDYYARERDFHDKSGRELAGSWAMTSATINVLADFFTEDGEIDHGDVSEASLVLQGNELIQEQSTYGTNNINLAEHIIETVKQKYRNGVMCVEMEVTGDTYKYEDGDVAISPSLPNPVFKKYDIVVPYVIRNGRKVPFATDEDGFDLPFKVIGVEYKYKGFLRQKLYLQSI